MLSFLPLHHTFECTVGFLYPLSVGSAIIFSKGIRHIGDEMKNFKITAMISVPIMMEKIYEKIIKGIEKKGKLESVKKGVKISNALQIVGIDIKKKLFKEIYLSLLNIEQKHRQEMKRISEKLLELENAIGINGNQSQHEKYEIKTKENIEQMKNALKQEIQTMQNEKIKFGLNNQGH